MKQQEDYIFYIKLGPTLNEAYYKLARDFSRDGITLLPVSIDSLVELMDGRKKSHLICMIGSELEREFYFKHVHKLLCYLVRSHRIYYNLISGFKKIMSREAFHTSAKNYSFLPLPQTSGEICAKIALSFYQRKKEEKRWPGGRSHLLPLVREI